MAVVEFERGQRIARLALGVGVAPVQPAGDHQMHHQKQVVFETDCDALADSADFLHVLFVGRA